MGLFEVYEAHPEESEIHDQAMRGLSSAQTAALLEAMDFAQAGVVVDVGGGTGELLAAILAKQPALHGILVDLPHVVARAPVVLGEHGVGDRVKVVGGSFFDSIPTEGRTYLMKTILHDWDDARATMILRNCRKAMAPEDRLLIVERLLPDFGQARRHAEAFLVDLEMLVMTPGGRERTGGEFRELLADADLRLVGTVATNSSVSILEARPA